MLPGAHPQPRRGPRARLHRPDRHPVPEHPVRRRRLPRRDAGDGDRVGDGPAPVGADPAVRRLPGLGPEPAGTADRRPWNFWIVVVVATIGNTLGLARGVRHRGVRRPAVPRALRASTCSSVRTRSSSPTRSSHGTARRPSSSAACCRSSGRSSASRPAWRACRSGGSSSTRRPARSCGRCCSSTPARSLGANWVQIREALQPFDLAIAIAVEIGTGRPVHLVAPRHARSPGPRPEREQPSLDRLGATPSAIRQQTLSEGLAPALRLLPIPGLHPLVASCQPSTPR